MGMFSRWVTRKQGHCHCHIDVPMSIVVWPSLVVAVLPAALFLVRWRKCSMTRSQTLVLASTSSLSALLATGHRRGNNRRERRGAAACCGVFTEVWSEPGALKETQCHKLSTVEKSLFYTSWQTVPRPPETGWSSLHVAQVLTLSKRWTSWNLVVKVWLFCWTAKRDLFLEVMLHPNTRIAGVLGRVTAFAVIELQVVSISPHDEALYQSAFLCKNSL